MAFGAGAPLHRPDEANSYGNEASGDSPLLQHSQVIELLAGRFGRR